MIPDLDKKIISLAFSDKKFAMELTEFANHEYFHSNVQWLYLALKQYFTDPNIKTIPTRNMVEEYVGDHPKSNAHLQLYDQIKGEICDPNEFSWLMEKLRFRYNDKVQKSIQSKIEDLQKLSVSKERINEINKLLKQSVVDIDEIHKRVVYREGTLRESAPERAKRYNYIEEHPEAARGILTGFSTFDRITNGLHRGELMLIAGDTGGGKSILMHNIAVNAYLGGNDPFSLPETWDPSKGKNVLFFSLEMPKDTIERRIDACVSGVLATHIRDGLLSEEDKRKYFRGLRFQKDYSKELYVVDMPKNVCPRDIELKYIEVCEAGIDVDLVVVDYMGIMSSNESTGSDWYDLGVITAQLHEIARIYEIPIITASQVNRTKDGQERYDTNRIARSSMAPTNVNIAIQIANRPDEDLRTDMVIYITKMRDGEKGHFTLIKDYAKMRVEDLVESAFSDDADKEIDVLI